MIDSSASDFVDAPPQREGGPGVNFMFRETRAILINSAESSLIYDRNEKSNFSLIISTNEVQQIWLRTSSYSSGTLAGKTQTKVSNSSHLMV